MRGNATRRPRLRAALTIAIFAAATSYAPIAHADDGIPPNCEEIPIFGLNPHIRTICDTSIDPDDGTWIRVRILHFLRSVRSTCGGIGYQGGQCPPGVPRDVIPDRYVKDEYVLTADTVPPGEPGHLGSPPPPP